MCSLAKDLNPIEAQWHQLKAHEIAGQIFDNEYDLAMMVIQGMKNRSEIGGSKSILPEQMN